MKKSEINWAGAKVSIWDIDDLDINQSIESQIELLKEDLLQTEFANGVILDLGWHPEFSLNGQFVLSVVKLKDPTNPRGEDWENPALKLHFRDMSQFVEKLNQAIEIATRLGST